MGSEEPRIGELLREGALRLITWLLVPLGVWSSFSAVNTIGSGVPTLDALRVLGVVPIMTALLLLGLWRRWPVTVRAAILVVALLASALLAVLATGPKMSNGATLCAALMFSAVFFGARGLLIVAAVVSTAILAIGIEAHRGVAFPYRTPDTDLQIWLTQAVVIVLFGVTTGLAVTRQLAGYEQSVREARASRSTARLLFEAAPDILTLTRVEDNTIVDVNRAFELTLGCPREEALGKTPSELGLWANPPERLALMARLERDAAFADAPAAIRCRDGRLLHVLISARRIELDGRPVTMTSLRDVSSAVAARQALEASEARLRLLGEAAFEGLLMTREGRFIDCNDRFTELLGYTADELRGRMITELIPPERVPEMLDAIARNHQEPYESVGIHKDGRRLDVEVRGRSLGGDGPPLRITAVRDITERRRAEDEQRRLIAELQARNAEMEQFTYTVSHDLKSPLVTISGFLAMVQDDLGRGQLDGVRADLARIGSAAQKMTRLLDDLLEMSRVGRVGNPPAAVPLGPLVADAIELLDAALRARGVTIDVAAELPAVFGDRVRLLQVVQNVVENAIKHMGPQAAPRVAVAVRPDPERVVLTIADNGIGIAPEHAERVFRLFEKLDPRTEGSGVGLALVRRIAEFHGGTAWIESPGLGGGTTVCVALPRPPG